MADLDITAAAEELGLPRSWLRDRVTAHAVPHHRYGKHVRFTTEDLAAIRAASAKPALNAPAPVVQLAPRRRRTAA